MGERKGRMQDARFRMGQAGRIDDVLHGVQWPKDLQFVSTKRCIGIGKADEDLGWVFAIFTRFFSVFRSPLVKHFAGPIHPLGKLQTSGKCRRNPHRDRFVLFAGAFDQFVEKFFSFRQGLFVDHAMA